jgi:hypothetical protein
MRSLILLLFLFVSLSICVAPAQSLSGPIEAFTFDAPTQSLRAVNGFPGSATFGPALLSGLDYGSVAPDKNYAIAFKNGHCLFVSGLDSSQLATAMIPGVFGRPDGAVWSSDGSIAILYSRSGNWIQTLADLPKAPHADPHLNLSVLGGSLSAIATDKQGKQFAIATSGPTGGVYLTTPSQHFIPLAKMANPIALSFSDDGASLYALDSGSLKLSVIKLRDWSSRAFSLSELHDPFAIHVGHDAANQPLVYVASRKDRLLGVYNAASEKTLHTIALRFQPTGIDAFGRNSFVVGSRVKSGDPLWLFTTAPRPEVYFVPAATTASGGPQ